MNGTELAAHSRHTMLNKHLNKIGKGPPRPSGDGKAACLVGASVPASARGPRLAWPEIP